jgi:hypothetical protein
MRKDIHDWLRQHLQTSAQGRADAQYLGLDPNRNSFEVRSARIAYRSRPDGGMIPQLLVGILQDQEKPINLDDPDGEKMTFVGGCTLVADLRRSQIRYCIRKNFTSEGRLARQREFASETSLSSLYFAGAELRNEPFALTHRGVH